MRKRAALAAAVVMVALTLPGCSGALLFGADHRLTFAWPPENAIVAAPFTVRWHAHVGPLSEPGAAKGRGDYFAVFIDRAPLAPGQSLLSLIDPQCAAQRHGCATISYFTQRNVYLTAHTFLPVQAVPQLSQHRANDQVHTLVIVLMNRRNQRVGEQAWVRTFRVAGTAAA